MDMVWLAMEAMLAVVVTVERAEATAAGAGAEGVEGTVEEGREEDCMWERHLSMPMGKRE